MYEFIRVATIREKILENEKISRSGKSRNFIFSQGNLEKVKKSQGVSKISEKASGNFITINCEQILIRNIPFVIFMV